jgi:hypothetical protein
MRRARPGSSFDGIAIGDDRASLVNAGRETHVPAVRTKYRKTGFSYSGT